MSETNYPGRDEWDEGMNPPGNDHGRRHDQSQIQREAESESEPEAAMPTDPDGPAPPPVVTSVPGQPVARLAADESDRPIVRPPAKPRVDTTFLVMLLAPLTGIALAIAATIPIGIIMAIAADDMTVLEDVEAWEAMLSAPIWDCIFTIIIFGGALGVVLLAAAISPRPWKQRIGLVKPNCSWWLLIPFIGGSIFVGHLEMFVLSMVFPEPSETLVEQYEMITQYVGMTFLLGVISYGLIPGFAEEILCRGYVQQRLTRRWGPAIGIFVASLYFGLLHFDMQHSLATFLGGLWFGIIAWRTNSIWFLIIAHGLYNIYVLAWGVWLGPDVIVEGAEALPKNWLAVSTATTIITGLLFLWGVLHLKRYGPTARDPVIG